MARAIPCAPEARVQHRPCRLAIEPLQDRVPVDAVGSDAFAEFGDGGARWADEEHLLGRPVQATVVLGEVGLGARSFETTASFASARKREDEGLSLDLHRELHGSGSLVDAERVWHGLT